MSHSKLDYVNGISILLPDIEKILDESRLSRKDRAVLTSIAYILKSLPTIRSDVDMAKTDIENIKKNDWWSYLKSRPTFSKIGGILLYLLLISDVRQALLKLLTDFLSLLEIAVSHL